MAETAQREKHGMTAKQSERERNKSKESSGIGILDGLRMIAGLLLINCIASYFVTGDSVTWNFRPWWIRPNVIAARLRQPVVLTDAELLGFDGRNDSLPIYLALNGTIYDVTAGAGRRIYGPGGPYNFFAGRDATRAYITGCFKEDAVADYRGVEWTFIPTDVPHFSENFEEAVPEKERDYRYEMVGQALEEVDKTIDHWAKMFRGDSGKEYFEVGYVKRKPGYMDKLPMRPLCTAAEKKRPKPKFDKTKEYKSADRAERAKRKRMEYVKLRDAAAKEEAQNAGAGAGSKGHDEI